MSTITVVEERAAATMQAVVQRRYSTEPEAVLGHERVAVPAIKDGEVLVRVRAAGVDRGTWHLMAGLPYLARAIGFGLRRPKTPTPGMAIAGVVEAVGAEVDGLRPGDEVFGTAKGAFAEFAVAKASRVVPKPANLSFVEAAAVPVSATTALQAVRDHGHVQAGHRVLVIGASGGVGSWAVQLSKAFGAEVTGVGSAGKLDFVRSIGADHVLDYAQDDVTDGTQQYDLVIDIGGNRRVRDLRRALTANGRLVITGGEHGGAVLGGIERNLGAALLSLFVSQKLGAFVGRERGADLDTLCDLIEAGAIAPVVDRTFPLQEAAAAIRYLVDGHTRGKIVITI